MALRLRSLGFDALTTQEAGRRHSEDESQLAYATANQRILFTHDIKDFVPIARSWAAQRRAHTGIVYCHKESSAKAFDWIQRLFEVYSADSLVNVTISLPVD